jgi:bacterial/archaeal transporter family-2 protein
MNKLIWILVAFICGAVLPIQAALNTRLGKVIESPAYASMISFLVGLVGIIIYILVTQQSVSMAGLKTVPVHLYIGGLLGAFFVTMIILVFPRIGPALTFGLVVAGQMIISVMLDHYKILVAEAHPISGLRLLGIALIVSGVIIIRKF